MITFGGRGVWTVWTSGIVQTAIYCDFFYYYIKSYAPPPLSFIISNYLFGYFPTICLFLLLSFSLISIYFLSFSFIFLVSPLVCPASAEEGKLTNKQIRCFRSQPDHDSPT
jgi:hypothetical protein